MEMSFTIMKVLKHFKKIFLMNVYFLKQFFRQNEVTNTLSSYLAVMLNETSSVYWPFDSSCGGPF